MKLPGNQLNDVFSEIDVRTCNGHHEIHYTTMVGLSGTMAESWTTGLALDASVSMMGSFGRRLMGSVPEEAKALYRKKGWVTTKEKHDGKTVHYYEEEAENHAVVAGYLSRTKNVVEGIARRFSAYLAEQLDKDASTGLIYWACGEDGKEIEILGRHLAQDLKSMSFTGPKKLEFGRQTHLLPAFKYFEEEYRSALRGFFIFITDGEINDLDSLKKFTTDLAKKIESKQRNFLKAVLIGVGDAIDKDQLTALDDMETGTNLDIWDHKVADDMKDLMEILAELVDENLIVAPFATIKDSNDNEVARYNDGFPAKGFFKIPDDQQSFTLQIEDDEFRQDIRRL